MTLIEVATVSNKKESAEGRVVYILWCFVQLVVHFSLNICAFLPAGLKAVSVLLSRMGGQTFGWRGLGKFVRTVSQKP